MTPARNENEVRKKNTWGDGTDRNKDCEKETRKKEKKEMEQYSVNLSNE